MADHFISVDPDSGAILWSHVIESGYVPSLAEVMRQHPGQTILKIAHTPLLHDPAQQPHCVVDLEFPKVFHPGGDFFLQLEEHSGEGWLVGRGRVPGSGKGPGR